MKNWFVLQTKPLKEARVEMLLTRAGFRVYYPKIKDEETGATNPLFPCYEFVLFDYPRDYQLVRYTRGVRRVVGNGRGPIPVEAAVIEEIRSREVEGFVRLEEDLGPPEPGDLVKVVKGPLRGLKGIFKKTLSGEKRVVILLNYVNYQGSLVIVPDRIRKFRADKND